MRTQLRTRLLIGFLCFTTIGAAENLALQVSYTLDPAPNWEDPADAGDAMQLTDGAFAPVPFWERSESVAWFKCKPVVVTLDLGRQQAIRGVSCRALSDAAGVPGVSSIEWPTALYLFIAGEDRQFRFAGELTSTSLLENGLPPEETPAAHPFKTDLLRTRGRYVALGIWSQPFIFLDEIEVYSGDPAWLNDPVRGDPVPDVKMFMSDRQVHAGVVRRLLTDAAGIRRKAAVASIEAKDKTVIAEELQVLERGAKALPAEYGEDFRAVLPLNDLHARILAVHARFWRAAGYPPVSVWTPRSAYDPLGLLDDPSKEALKDPAGASVTLDMMQNEYRSAAFNISNGTEGPLAVAIDITGLPGGVNPAWLAVHEAAWTDTAAGHPVADALMPLAGGAPYEVLVPAGMTRQVWLLVHSKCVPAGVHRGMISLKTGDARIREVPLEVSIRDLRFPDKPRLHFGGWDYTDQDQRYEITLENRDAFIRHLREHFVDSPWGSSACLPFGTYDEAGNMTAPPDTRHFDAWLARWPEAGQYCVSVGTGNERIARFAPGSETFDRAVGAWATFWASTAASRSILPEQVVLLLVDEPNTSEQDALILAWAKAIRAADTGMRIWEDPIWDDMTQANQEMIDACHILCVNRPTALADPKFAEYFRARSEQGAQLDFYSCNGPARLLDPYAYYRLQAWTAWQYGAKSMYFWAFGSAGAASSFNEYRVVNCAYTPLFIDGRRLYPGKQMEACREGIEDYEYLAMLRDAITLARENPAIPRGAVERAQILLDEGPGRVLEGASPAGLSRRSVQGRGTADNVRTEILSALSELTGEGRTADRVQAEN